LLSSIPAERGNLQSIPQPTGCASRVVEKLVRCHGRYIRINRACRPWCAVGPENLNKEVPHEGDLATGISATVRHNYAMIACRVERPLAEKRQRAKLSVNSTHLS
jgi:hypothetical protein